MKRFSLPNFWRRASRRLSLWLNRRSEVEPKHPPKISRPGTPERVRAAREVA